MTTHDAIDKKLREGFASPVILLPGLWDSGQEHWQTYWEKIPNTIRVRQRVWDTPKVDDWITELDRVVTAAGPASVIAAHSLGCATVAHWAHRYTRSIQGALLVAPSDLEAPSYPAGPVGFTPMPLEPLPFATIVVRSTDDQYVTPERAEEFARNWGSRLVTINNAGHLNSASQLGFWADGLALVDELVKR